MTQLTFDAFHMDLARHRLWQGEREIPLRPKAWDVLRYLIERPDFLVTKDALHHAIWADTAVSDDTRTKLIAELRQALGDSPRTPRIIETVHGRGFRFVAQVKEASRDVSTAPQPLGASGAFVGRQAELAKLHEALRLARQGARQLVLITGESGIGKTALTEEFLRVAISHEPGLYILRGQCIQQYGQREPYMPVLDALERLLGSPLGAPLIPLFRRFAPCWYVQIPWLLAEGEPSGFQGAMMTAAPQRMLREIGAFLDAMATHATVILVLEDLHWSDHATTDLLSFLAERRDPARVLTIGTFRPADASTQEHPIREVRQTLRSRGRSVDLALPYLSPADLAAYLRHRFGEGLEHLASLIHERTDGNPLFAVAIVEDLIRRGRLQRAGGAWVLVAVTHGDDLAVPSDLTEMVTAQFHGLGSEERVILEAASVAGVSFAPWAIARALGREVEEVEAVAEQLVRTHLFLATGSRADDHGPVRRYDFFHALHHQVIYEQIADERRRRLHQAIGEALESASGDRLAEIAAELSVHFERSRDHARAVKYLRLCITSAQQRFAHQEAVTYARNARSLLEALPEGPPRQRAELEIRLLEGVALNATRGYLSPEVQQNYERARQLCEQVGDVRQLFEIVFAACYAQVSSQDEAEARRGIEELSRIAQRVNTPELELRAEVASGRLEMWNAHFGVAVGIFRHVLERVAAESVEFHPGIYGVHPVFAAYAHAGVALWFHGFPDQGLGHALQGVAHAEKSGRLFDLASGLCHLAFIELSSGRADAAASAAARATAVCRDHEIVYFQPLAEFIGAAARVELGDVTAGLAEMTGLLADQRAVTAAFLTDFMLMMMASAHGRLGRWGEALACVEEGIAIAETHVA